ncbi:hypothetical protein GJW-30_1_01200 [Variibacter gotjawalensis]|uniref:IrrE N-terminal-like domain-containing protein n=1 Tax=Variibacter gotjawalensis TaxID=1333996 RepID=A0A0S3PRU5_9BRAD|nr:hypothetical protein [Variibacter gotjawalensis]RZS50839.1 hypothetical protein EV661_3310 [Variibacter gotjawalensis]BAT58673.1 hypothetical protein GJW-30_1_01200 [Variibacter gotjawalensis]
MWPFRSKPLLDAETAAWHVENFAWLLSEFGHGDDFSACKLVLPKPGFFPSDGERGHAKALRIFRQTQTYCGMGDWEIDLVADNNPVARREAPAYVMLQHGKHALGTYSRRGNRSQITYVPTLLERPEHLIATFAHELAHDLLSSARTPPPSEADENEFLTDLTAVFLGFGVFLANARFDFETSGGGGWSMRRAGYLPEADLIFALALFLRTRQIGPDAAMEWLKPHLGKLLRKALGDLPDTHADVAALRAALADAQKIAS